MTVRRLNNNLKFFGNREFDYYYESFAERIWWRWSPQQLYYIFFFIITIFIIREYYTDANAAMPRHTVEVDSRILTSVFGITIQAKGILDLFIIRSDAMADSAKPLFGHSIHIILHFPISLLYTLAVEKNPFNLVPKGF